MAASHSSSVSPSEAASRASRRARGLGASSSTASNAGLAKTCAELATDEGTQGGGESMRAVTRLRASARGGGGAPPKSPAPGAALAALAAPEAEAFSLGASSQQPVVSNRLLGASPL